MRVATSGDGTLLDQIKSFDTPKNFDEIFSLLMPFKREGIKAVLCGIAGVLDKEKLMLLRSPNLPEWVGKPIKKKLQEFFNTQVYFENDAALAGLGEACYGAGRDYGIVSYLTISTGIGGARIVDKKIDANSWGFEPGQQIIDLDVTIWPESKNFNSENLTLGSIESYISGSALGVRYGAYPFEIKDPQIWNEVEKLLAVALNNVIVFWSPDIIILGGGMVLDSAISVDNVKNNLKKSFKVFPELPVILKAELGDKSGLYGGLKMVDKVKL